MNTVESHLLDNIDEFVGFVRRRLREPELAADVVQESLLKAVKSADQIHDPENAKAWFYRILRRTLIDVYRRRNARENVLAELEHELELMVDNEEERLICACMERLIQGMSPQYAVLITRIDLNEEPPGEVAESLGVSRNNLNVRLHRARQQLKSRLEENCRICAKHGCLDCHCQQQPRY